MKVSLVALKISTFMHIKPISTTPRAALNAQKLRLRVLRNPYSTIKPTFWNGFEVVAEQRFKNKTMSSPLKRKKHPNKKQVVYMQDEERRTFPESQAIQILESIAKTDLQRVLTYCLNLTNENPHAEHLLRQFYRTLLDMFMFEKLFEFTSIRLPLPSPRNVATKNWVNTKTPRLKASCRSVV